MKSEEQKYVSLEKYKLTGAQKLYVAFKALVDFFIGLVGIIVFAIPMAIIAIAIKLDSPGPVFFKQQRIGKNGKDYNILKFRSMSQNARHDVAGYEYKEASSYITRVGNFIRKTSLDELPQFFLLLTGKMSLIGYRPSQENETELNTAREKLDLYQIRPGISGWAQVNGRDILASHPTLKAQYDGYYLEHISPLLDIKIILLTIYKVLSSKDIQEGMIEGLQEEKAKQLQK